MENEAEGYPERFYDSKFDFHHTILHNFDSSVAATTCGELGVLRFEDTPVPGQTSHTSPVFAQRLQGHYKCHHRLRKRCGTTISIKK